MSAGFIDLIGEWNLITIGVVGSFLFCLAVGRLDWCEPPIEIDRTDDGNFFVYRAFVLRRLREREAWKRASFLIPLIYLAFLLSTF